jgi:hypothetical protein
MRGEDTHGLRILRLRISLGWRATIALRRALLVILLG